MAAASGGGDVPLATLRAHADAVNSVAFQDDEHLLSTSHDGTLKLWSLTTHRPLLSIDAHKPKPGLAVQPLPPHKALTHGRDGMVKLWDLKHTGKTPSLQIQIESHSFCKCALQTKHGETGRIAAALSDELVIALPSPDATQISILDLRHGKEIHRLIPDVLHQRVGMCMCLRFLGSFGILSGWEDGTLQHFDLRSNSPTCCRRLHTQPMLCVDTDSKFRRAITGSADCKVCVTPLAMNVDNTSAMGNTCTFGGPQEIEIPVSKESSGAGGIASICVRGDSKIVAAAGWDHRIRVWQWRNMKPLAILRMHTQSVNDVSFSPRGSLLASASSDHTIGLWKLGY